MQSCQTGRSFKTGIRNATGALALAALCSVAIAPLRAQSATVSTTPSSAPVKKPVHHKRKAKPAPEPVVAQAPVQPEQPPKPNWPANDPSQPARVNWNGRDLTVTATNASLSQVLHEVASATGLKVEGLDSPSPRDQRIYGSFGPAPARDVLNQLLDGSGYNSILIGDRGEGNPRELLLTAQVKGGSPANKQLNPSGNQNNDDDTPEEPEPEQPEPQRPQQGPPPPGARPAQQYLQDLRNQQQQQQQQQVPQQPNNPGQTSTPGQTPTQNPTQTPPN